MTSDTFNKLGNLTDNQFDRIWNHPGTTLVWKNITKRGKSGERHTLYTQCKTPKELKKLYQQNDANIFKNVTAKEEFKWDFKRGNVSVNVPKQIQSPFFAQHKIATVQKEEEAEEEIHVEEDEEEEDEVEKKEVATYTPESRTKINVETICNGGAFVNPNTTLKCPITNIKKDIFKKDIFKKTPSSPSSVEQRNEKRIRSSPLSASSPLSQLTQVSNAQATQVSWDRIFNNSQQNKSQNMDDANMEEDEDRFVMKRNRADASPFVGLSSPTRQVSSQASIAQTSVGSQSLLHPRTPVPLHIQRLEQLPPVPSVTRAPLSYDSSWLTKSSRTDSKDKVCTSFEFSPSKRPWYATLQDT